MKFWAILGAGAILLLALSHWWMRETGYDAGFRAARLECTEAALKTAAANKVERVADQEKISKIEADWLAERATVDRLKTVAEIDAAYESDQKDEGANAPGKCNTPGISERMRDVINRAGRH